MRAVIYCRYSAGPQQTEQSLEGQIRVCKKYIEDNGLTLTGVYRDSHISGTSDKRPEFQKMIRDAELGLFDVLVVYSSDRFSRNKYDSVIYKAKLKRAGVKIRYAAENIPDGPEGILLESLMEGWAQYYSEELSRKVKRGMQESARKNKSTGPKPFGYRSGPDKEWIVDEERAKVVKFIFSKFLSGHTRAEIIKELNARGHRTSKGKYFTHNTVNAILSSRAYTGAHTWNDIEVSVPAIISQEDFDAAQIKLRHPKRQPKGDFKLTGKLFCGVCGAHFKGTSGTGKNGVRHYYYKATCSDWKNIPRDVLEEYVFTEAKKALTAPVEVEKLIKKINTYRISKNSYMDEYGSLKKAWSKLDAEANRIVEAIGAGTDSPRLKKRLHEIEHELIPQVEEKMKAVTPAPDLTEEQIRKGLIAFLHSSDEVLTTLINKVIIYRDSIQIYFNLLEGDRVKTTDLIMFDQTSECSTNLISGRTLSATPWGLRLVTRNTFATRSVTAS